MAAAIPLTQRPRARRPLADSRRVCVVDIVDKVSQPIITLLRAAVDAAKDDSTFQRFVRHWNTTVKNRIEWLKEEKGKATDAQRQLIEQDIAESLACLKDLNLEQ